MLERDFKSKSWAERLDPFEALISTILSQATNDRNRDLALKNLKRKLKLTPQIISKTDAKDIADSIHPAGLENMKAPRIKEAARIILEEYSGDLRKVLRLPQAEAREKLMDLPGVGFKTADVMLAFVARRNVMPVDTHISRIAKRLGVVNEKAEYEEIRKTLEELIPAEKRLNIHLSMIAFGRKICKAPKPLCYRCRITRYCKWFIENVSTVKAS